MLKYLALTLLLLFAANSATAQGFNTSFIAQTLDTLHPDKTIKSPLVLTGPIILLKTHNINIGNTPQSYTPLKYDLYYTNTGSEPLIITKVRTSCSCTVASYPKMPLQPGDSDKIVLELDANHVGSFNKVVAVYSNAANNYDSSISCAREVVKINWKVIEIKDKKAIKDYNP